jgi:hypothetical protein
MQARSSPKLDLATIFATKAFSEDDLAHNRRGVLSPAQDEWRVAHPGFVDDDGEDGAIETLVGRVTIEGRYVAGRMGETTFAALVQPGRRLSLRPGIERSLVRGAPYRAYAAYGWIWSIEPIAEDELRAATSAVVTYRSAADAAGAEGIARALEDALSIELSFSEGDVAANRSGRFSAAQRSSGLKKLFFASLRLLVSSAALVGLFAVLGAGAPFPVLATVFGVVSLVAFWVNGAWSLVDALARVVPPRPLCVPARLDNDPTNPDNVVLRSDVRPLKIKRAAIAIAEAPFSELRAWRFEVFFLPWTGSVVSVRPIAPRDAAGV